MAKLSNESSRWFHIVLRKTPAGGIQKKVALFSGFWVPGALHHVCGVGECLASCPG